MNKSFTLIEILVVIVVVGILSSFILVGMSSITNKANIAKSQAFLNSMDNSLLLSRVSEWKLDDSSGTDSWNGRTATLVNTPILTPNCPQGSCYTFNSSLSQYAWIADNDNYFNFQTQMSAFVWVKGNPQDDKIFWGQYNTNSNQRAWAIQARNTGHIRVGLNDNGISDAGHRKSYIGTSLIAFNNEWHLVGFTWNFGVLKLYVDGKEETGINPYADDPITTIYNSSAHITISCSLTGITPENIFTGSLDDARLYNKPILTSEAQQNYYFGLSNLLINNGFVLKEYNQRLTQLKEFLVFE